MPTVNQFLSILEGGAGIIKAVSENENVAAAATIVGAGADMAKVQIQAGPDATMTERLVSEFENREDADSVYNLSPHNSLPRIYCVEYYFLFDY